MKVEIINKVVGGCPTCQHSDCEARNNSDTSLCPSHSAIVARVELTQYLMNAGA